MGHVIANIYITLADNGANHIVTFVHAAAESVAILLFGGFMFPHKGMTLHMSGWFFSCYTQKGGGEINESDPPVNASAHLIIGRSEMLPFFRHMYDQGNIQPGEIWPALASGHT